MENESSIGSGESIEHPFSFDDESKAFSEAHPSWDVPGYFKKDSQAEGLFWPGERKVEDLIHLRSPLPETKIDQRSEEEKDIDSLSEEDAAALGVTPAILLMAKGGSRLPEPYLEHEWKRLSERKEVKDTFRDQVVVDLGAGKRTDGYKLAALAGSKAYVGVDPNYAYELRQGNYGMGRLVIQGRVAERGIDFPELPRIRWSIVDLDALSFLRSVPDNSVSFITSGIDDAIIRNKEYAKALTDEIKRTLAPTGGLLSVHSYLYSGDENKKIKIDNYIRIERK